LIATITACGMCVPAWAAPVFGKRTKLRQPDGTLVEVRIWGDEYHQIVESLDGFALVRDPTSGAICYAKPADGKEDLASSGVVVGHPIPQSLALKRHLRPSAAAIRNRVSAARAAFSAPASAGTPQVAGTGEPVPATTPSGRVEGICLLVDFSDDPGTIPPQTVWNFCNQIGYNGFGNNGSVRDYFYHVSKGHLTYTNFVPGQYYRASQPKSYYDNPNYRCPTRAQELVIEALNALDAAGLDFSMYDADRDGQIDAINCLYAGTTSAGWAYGLWPHCAPISFSADGVTASRYQITDMDGALYLDTFCHENGHLVCNWPDLYDYAGSSSGIGKFCLMCDMASRTNPVQPCAYLKYIAGWTQTTLLVSHQVGLSISSDQNQVYKYSHPTKPNEYYLIENRQQTGRDTALPDAGLAIWHIDTYGTNTTGDPGNNEVTLVQADGRWDLEYGANQGDGTDLWKSPTYTACGSHTTPSTKWWDGNASGLGLSQISNSGSVMTFTFAAAAIVLDTQEIVHVIYPGRAVPDDTFTVTNASMIAPMDYTIGCTAGWVTISPSAGSSMGEADTITLTYRNDLIQGWQSGSYGAIVFVGAENAWNSPQAISVQVIIGGVAADLDTDTDVDQADFGLLQACMSGFGIKQTNPDCAKADLDKDGDVDHDDVAVFMGCLSGADVPADLNCE